VGAFFYAARWPSSSGASPVACGDRDKADVSGRAGLVQFALTFEPFRRDVAWLSCVFRAPLGGPCG